MNYEELNNPELDKLAADKFGIDDSCDNCGERVCGCYMTGIGSGNTFRPTQPDSNQADTHILPKLRELANKKLKDNETLSLNTYHYLDNDPYYEVWFDHEEKIDGGVVSGPVCEAEGENLNRTKLISYLKLWDKLNGDKS